MVPELVLLPALPADALSPIAVAANAVTRANLTPIICFPPVGVVSPARRTRRISLAPSTRTRVARCDEHEQRESQRPRKAGVSGGGGNRTRVRRFGGRVRRGFGLTKS